MDTNFSSRDLYLLISAEWAAQHSATVTWLGYLLHSCYQFTLAFPFSTSALRMKHHWDILLQVPASILASMPHFPRRTASTTIPVRSRRPGFLPPLFMLQYADCLCQWTTENSSKSHGTSLQQLSNDQRRIYFHWEKHHGTLTMYFRLCSGILWANSISNSTRASERTGKAEITWFASGPGQTQTVR